MVYRKFKADKIFDGFSFLKNHVLVTKENGVIEALVPAAEGEEAELLHGILSPGLINCHCHLELSHMRGRIPERTGLVDFVFKVVTERHHPDEEILEAIEEAENEMLRNGVVAVGDICNNLLSLQQKRKGRLCYYNFIEASGWLPGLAASRFERAKTIYDAYEQLSVINYQRSAVSIVPHAPYSVSPGLWEHIRPYFEGKVVSIHNQETVFEDEFFMQGTGDLQRMYQLMKIDNSHHLPSGRSSLQSSFDQLTSARNIILVHNSFTKQEDIDYVNRQSSIVNGGRPNVSNAKTTNENGSLLPVLPTTNHPLSTFFCLCINANQYIESRVPPIDLLRKNHCSIVLGTDSLASNRSLNILDEMQTIRKKFPSIALEEMLQWATSNGAKALQMDDELGSFANGKKPGLILIDENDLSVKRII